MANPEPGINLVPGLENSEPLRNAKPEQPHPPIRALKLKGETIAAFFEGPVDADLMKEAMAVIRSPDVDPSDKLIAYENLEELVGEIPNTDQMKVLGLWALLLEELDNPEPEMRGMAARCLGAAVQNYRPAQDILLIMDGIQKLAKLAMEDQDRIVRRRCIFALGSEIRCNQPASDEVIKHLSDDIVRADKIVASDFDQIDDILQRMRER